MRKGLERYDEQDKAQVAEADNPPRETVEEADIIVDDGRRAHLRAERARAVFHMWVAPECIIHGLLAWDSLGFHLTGGLTLVALGEVDVREGVWRAVCTEEVKEAYGAAKASSCDKWRLFAWGVDRAGVSVVDTDLYVWEVKIIASRRRRNSFLNHWNNVLFKTYEELVT